MLTPTTAMDRIFVLTLSQVRTKGDKGEKMSIRIFGYHTLSALKDILANNRTDVLLEELFFRHGILPKYREFGMTAKWKKLMYSFEYLSRGTQNEQSILSDIVTETLKDFYHPDFLTDNPELVRGLAQDGFTLNEEGELIPIISPTVEPKKEEGLVETLLDKYGLAVAKNHLKQAYDNYIEGNWEASNACLRAFLQDVFDNIALKLWSEEATKKEAGGSRRKLLQEKGFIEDATEGKLVSSFFSFASYEGSHPGISDEPDCRMRRYMAVALSSYYLEKLRSILS